MIRVLCLKLILITLIQNNVVVSGQRDDNKSPDVARDGETKEPGAATESEKQTTEDYQRHIIEEGVKSALFGSNSYDPIKQVFEPQPKKGKPGEGDHPAAGKVSNSSDQSTVLGDATTPATTEPEGEKERKAFASASTTSNNGVTPSSTTQISTIYTRQSVTTPGDIALVESTPTSSWWSRYKFRSDKLNNQKLAGAPNALI